MTQHKVNKSRLCQGTSHSLGVKSKQDCKKKNKKQQKQKKTKTKQNKKRIVRPGKNKNIFLIQVFEK